MSFNSKTATCTVDAAKFDSKKALKALADAGYGGSYVIKPKK